MQPIPRIAVVIGNKMVVYYQGADDWLHYNTLDGTTWTGYVKAPNIGI